MPVALDRKLNHTVLLRTENDLSGSSFAGAANVWIYSSKQMLDSGFEI